MGNGMSKAVVGAALAASLLGVASAGDTPGSEPVPDLALPDPGGATHRLAGPEGTRATVLFFLGTECPMVTRYLGRVAALHGAYAVKGVAFFGVNPHALESPEAIAAHAKASALPFPVLLDRDQKLADRLRVESVPTAILLDASRRVRYRGAVDDHKMEELSRRPFLRDAIEAVLAGGEPAPAETPVAGCAVQRALPAAGGAESGETPTYAGRVAAILDAHCVACHRPGQVAPFALDSFESARRHARDIRRATASRSMPPWKPANLGDFHGERRLPDGEIETIARWVAGGAPLGDAGAVPPPRKFPEGWMIGEPDVVLTAPEYDVPARGPDEYRCFPLETSLPEDAWVSAVEVRPGNLRVVHHVIAYVDTSGISALRDGADPAPGYRSQGTGPGFQPSGEMSGWAPGVMPVRLPEGVGRLLPKGARIVLEVHYHKNGRPEKDHTSIGLHLAKAPVKKRLRIFEIVNPTFRIPAGAERHQVTARTRVREAATALFVMPHMHLLGREARIEAELPDGQKRTLVHIPDWDFNWQDFYLFRDPLKLPEGTRIRLDMWYDNSEKNPNNPNRPPKDVRWGEQTTDEMCLGYVAYTRDAEDRTAEGAGAGKDGKGR
ncbi:MAG: redoxin domain-containing protein [Planctomycetales bacterium]|nr:redoxin domain-containing protein [Planctomycetales bacterium]